MVALGRSHRHGTHTDTRHTAHGQLLVHHAHLFEQQAVARRDQPGPEPASAEAATVHHTTASAACGGGAHTRRRSHEHVSGPQIPHYGRGNVQALPCFGPAGAACGPSGPSPGPGGSSRRMSKASTLSAVMIGREVGRTDTTPLLRTSVRVPCTPRGRHSRQANRGEALNTAHLNTKSNLLLP